MVITNEKQLLHGKRYSALIKPSITSKQIKALRRWQRYIKRKLHERHI